MMGLPQAKPPEMYEIYEHDFSQLMLQCRAGFDAQKIQLFYNTTKPLSGLLLVLLNIKQGEKIKYFNTTYNQLELFHQAF